MDPNKPTDKEIKDAARQGRSIRPGVVPMSEAAALDQRIAEKTRKESATAAPAELDQLERDVSSKQKNAPAVAAATPGAFSSQPSSSSARADLSNFESDVAAKQRARAPAASAVEGLDQKVAAKMAAASSGGKGDLENLEASVQAKMAASGGPAERTSRGTGGRASGAMKPNSQGDDLSRLDDRIAAKNTSAVPRSLQETEDIVTKKKTGDGITHGGTQIVPQDKVPPEQSPQQAKEGLGTEAQQGLQPHDDVEYGEYGGPTEQGLAVAFAVEEEAEDAFIPAAIEYDPDAKPPLIKNRRFRLYAFLAIIVVLVGTISAAVGITLAGKKTKYDIAERETSGVREAVELLVGAEKMQEPNSPHSKALDWMMYGDPLQLVPSNETFAQRYILALFYYSTSVERPWDGGCAPAAEGETDDCLFGSYFDTFEKLAPENIQRTPWIRWLSGKPECTWAGLQCSDDNHVRSIEISAANMTGSLPEELGELNFLQALVLKFNQLGGPLPENLSKLRHLVDLSLHANKFTGTIPPSYFTAPLLQRVNFANNKLKGTIPTSIGLMVDGKALYLSNNALTGTIPTEIGRMHSLSFFWLNRNSLNGTIPTEIGNLRSVIEVLVARNQLTGTIPSEIGQLPEVNVFNLADNNLRGQIPSSLYSLSNIYNLDVSKNQLTGTISSAIGDLHLLFNLRLHYNDFTGTIPSSLGSIGALNNVQLYANFFNGSIPLELCPEKRLEMKFKEVSRFVADCKAEADGSPPEIECSCCSNCCSRDMTCLTAIPV